jgi:hypothetical protein
MFGNHTRQTTIIRLRRVLVWVLLLGGAQKAAAQPLPKSESMACLTCVIFHIPGADETRLQAARGLAGLTLVVAADEIGPGVLRGVRVDGKAALFVVPAPFSGAEAVFSLKILVTAIRASAPDARILLDGPAVPEPVAGYVDGRVERGPMFEAPTVEELVAASLRPSADPWLITIKGSGLIVDADRKTNPDPLTLLAEFAARRALSSEVVGAVSPTVEQIVARHQATRRRQELRIEQTIARGTTSLLFEVPGFVAPLTITAETVVFRRPGMTEMVQRDIRVNGASIAAGSASSPPQLPLIEPERVATPPLVITLTEAYRYRLEGRTRIEGADAYVVSFQGTDASGRAWIDATTFALRRLETIQSGLRGAIVSSEQHEEFGSIDVDGEPVWLPVRTTVFQMYEGAGHRTPIHRVIETRTYEINPSTFDAQLRAAYASPDVMLRETPDGFRYLLRDGRAPEGAARSVALRAGERIRTAVFGVLVDPNITVPLPFAGLSYVDLNLFDTGAQLNAFFGGSYGQLSWSVPSIGGTRWQAHGRAFGIAARYNDRAFRAGVEQFRENITQRPAHLSAGLMRRLSSRWRARIDYELDYTSFDRADTTDSQFIVPADAVVHGLVTALEGEAGAWSARLWWNPAARQRWSPWGLNGGEQSSQSFQRFGTVVARTLALGRTVGSRVELAWVDGKKLDRFSRYSFGAFENRLHGYPTASIRYERGAVARTATSWSGRGWRVDAFGDMAVVRDPGFGDSLRGYPGVGAALEAGGPFRTLWSVEWGYGFRARREDGGTGTQAVRVTGYRTF